MRPLFPLSSRQILPRVDWRDPKTDSVALIGFVSMQLAAPDLVLL